jgi:hypothetical protein
MKHVATMPALTRIDLAVLRLARVSGGSVLHVTVGVIAAPGLPNVSVVISRPSLA